MEFVLHARWLIMIALLQSLRRSVERRPTVQKVLLGCGTAAFVLYVGMDTIAALRYDGYRYADQTISELSAIDAPTRSFWLPPGLVYSGLTLAFGLGVWASAGKKRSLRAVGIMAAVVGLTGFVGWPFAPMHQREVLAAGGETWADTMHLVLGGVNSLLFVMSIAIGARAFGQRFRHYSIATVLIVLVAGALTGLDAPKVAANEPTPWLGIIERIAVFGSMLWYAVLAIGLLRAQGFSIPQALRKSGPKPKAKLQVS
jgi:hypothetical protein